MSNNVGNVGNVGMTVNVSLEKFSKLCKEAKAAGVDNDLCNQIVTDQPKQSSWTWTATKVATATKVVIAGAVLGAVLYGTWSYGFSQGAETAAGIGLKNVGKLLAEPTFIQRVSNFQYTIDENFAKTIYEEAMKAAPSIPSINFLKDAVLGLWNSATEGYGTAMFRLKAGAAAVGVGAVAMSPIPSVGLNVLKFGWGVVKFVAHPFSRGMPQ